MQIISPNSVIININSIKFLGLNIDTTLSWKDHITELSRLNKAFLRWVGCILLREDKWVIVFSINATGVILYNVTKSAYNLCTDYKHSW
jgi:hypothetical protein